MRPFFLMLNLGFLLCLPLLGIAQETRIKLLDSRSNEPIGYANVLVSSLENNLLKHGYVSDKNGWILPSINETSLVQITYVGYRNYVDTISPAEEYTFYLDAVSYNVDEFVVTGQIVESRQDKSIYSVKVINSKEIEQRAAVSIKDLLATESNIRISHDNVLGSSITMQGLGGEHIKFLIDGVPVIGRENGNIDLDQLSLQNVDHIEIINGPMSVVYGSNALAGVINIITKTPDRMLFSTNVDAYYESVGVYNLNLNASGTRKRNAFSFSGGRNFFDGYSVFDTTRWQQWKPKEQWNFSGDYKYTFNKAFVKVGASWFQQELRDNGALLPPYFETTRDKYFFTKRFVTSIDSRYDISKKSQLKLLASFSNYDKIKNTYLNDLTSGNKKLVPNEQDTTRFNDVIFRLVYSLGDEDSKLKYFGGLDLNREEGRGKRIKDEYQQIGDYSVFTGLNYSPVRVLSLQAGLRFIYNTQYVAPIVYSLNAKYDISEFFMLRASLASGFRAPSLKELYLEFVDVNHDIHGNQNLLAETSVSTNILFQYNSNNTRDYVWGIELNLFNNNIKDNIQLIPQSDNSNVYTYMNVNRFISRGAEIGFNNSIYPWLSMKLGFAVTGQNIDYSGLDKRAFDYYYGISTSVNYSLRKWNIDFSLYYKYNGEYPQIYFVGENEEPEIRFMQAYHSLDLNLSKWFWKRRLNLQLGAKNIFDNTNINLSDGQSGGIHNGGGGSVPVNWGRTYFIRFQFKFSK